MWVSELINIRNKKLTVRLIVSNNYYSKVNLCQYYLEAPAYEVVFSWEMVRQLSLLDGNSPELKIFLHVFTLHLLHCASIIVCPTGRIFPCCFLPVLQITTYSQPWGSIAPSYEFQASVFTFSTMLGFAIIFLPSSFAQSAVSDRAVSLNAKYMYVY